MIPCLAVVRIRGRNGRGVCLWIPLVFVWILLLPVSILVLPGLFLYCVIGRVSLVRAAKALGAVIAGLKGARIEVEESRHSVSLRIA